MGRQKLLDNHNTQLFATFIMCRVIKPDGFRLRDVDFCFNLVNNWIYGVGTKEKPDFQLVQISRVIDEFVKNKWIVRKKHKKPPVFQMTLAGLSHFFHQMVNPDRLLTPYQVIFIFYLLSTYGKFFKTYFLYDDIFLSTAQTQRLEKLLNPETIVHGQLELIKERLGKLDERIEENDDMLEFIGTERMKAADRNDIIQNVDRRFSYQMAYQKPFKTFLKEIPSELLDFEIQSGFRNRRDLLFLGTRNYYQRLIDQYNELI